MLPRFLAGLMAGLFPRQASTTCGSNLVIDDFSKFHSNTNSLGQWTSGTNMASHSHPMKPH